MGTQQVSKGFWSLPVWREIGVTQLAMLGTIDPIFFVGWEMMDELANEIRLFDQHFTKIDFEAETKSSYLAHLVYCHRLLVSLAPQDSIPMLIIG
jgi:hypothetical protein